MNFEQNQEFAQIRIVTLIVSEKQQAIFVEKERKMLNCKEE